MKEILTSQPLKAADSHLFYEMELVKLKNLYAAIRE